MDAKLVDFSFTPEQEELRAQARDYLAAHPEAPVVAVAAAPAFGA